MRTRKPPTHKEGRTFFVLFWVEGGRDLLLSSLLFLPNFAVGRKRCFIKASGLPYSRDISTQKAINVRKARDTSKDDKECFNQCPSLIGQSPFKQEVHADAESNEESSQANGVFPDGQLNPNAENVL